MAFQVSPGVNVSEIDLTTVVPQVSTSIGALAGAFRWGPVDQRVLVSSEDDFTFSPFLILTKIFFTLSRLYPNPIKIFDNSLLESINEINR